MKLWNLKQGGSRCAQLFMLSLAFSISAHGQVREPLPVPDLPGFRTLKCDFHLHTVFSDGEVWPTTRVAEAWRDGLDALAITDHTEYNPHREDLKPDLARVFELARQAAERLGLILIPGVEIAERDIHFNALFVTDGNALRGALPLLELLEKAKAQNAFAFWNHPGWKQTAEWFPVIATAHERRLFQGMELVNGTSLYPEAYPWIRERKLTILANSDAHQPIPPSEPGAPRTITLVFAKTYDAAGVREALEAGRTAAWMGGEVWGADSHLRGLWEGAVKFEMPARSLKPGGPAVGIRFHNTSSIPLRMRFRQGPEWLRGFGGEARMRGQSILGGAISVAKNAPAGRQKAEIEIEVLNYHTGPGSNLSVRLPLEIRVEP